MPYHAVGTAAQHIIQQQDNSSIVLHVSHAHSSHESMSNGFRTYRAAEDGDVITIQFGHFTGSKIFAKSSIVAQIPNFTMMMSSRD